MSQLTPKERRDRDNARRRKHNKSKRKEAEKSKRAAKRLAAREERTAEKGRKSLVGLDRYGFQAALDEVVEGRVSGLTEPIT